MPALHTAVLISLAWCLWLLTTEVLLALALGRRVHAPGRAPAWRGVVYAFGPGMMPWAKESARRHLGVFLCGVAYHAAIVAGLAVLALTLTGRTLPGRGTALLAAVLAGGVCAGLGLLARRAGSAMLRRISVPDDFVSNGLVTLFIAAALAAALDGRGVVPLLGTAIAVFLYAPLGKIRHCVFFPVARVNFGLFVGRRALLGVPPRGGPA